MKTSQAVKQWGGVGGDLACVTALQEQSTLGGTMGTLICVTEL